MNAMPKLPIKPTNIPDLFSFGLGGS